jgi:2-phospho-L-lactate guanylyltransferase
MAAAVRALIPIRSFDGMTRLSGHLEPEERRQFARELADRTVRAALGANTRVSVITADVTVQQWAIVSGVGVISERDSQGLDAAATAGVEEVGDDPWLVVHADLPAIDSGDVQASVQAIGSGYLLAPSHDGGTSLIGGTGPGFPFQYGPGSFRLHLAAIHGEATVLARLGLALDLDHPRDLEALRRLGFLKKVESRK